MKIQSSDNCSLLTVEASQLSELFQEGLVEDIEVTLTHNCCDKYNFTISSGTGDCVFTAYGDYLASPIDLYPVDFSGICGIAMRRFVDGQQEDEFPVGPRAILDCEDCFDISTPMGRNDLEVIVNDWLTSRGGGTFSIVVTDGIPNTQFENPVGSFSTFTMTFTDLVDGWYPRLYQIGGSCGNSAGGFYSVASMAFTCGGISTDAYVFNEGNLQIRPTLMGKTQFPDGVYEVSIKAMGSDGSKVTINECYVMDCDLKCKVLESGNSEAYMIYYLLKNSAECDCDCKTLCDLLKLTY